MSVLCEDCDNPLTLTRRALGHQTCLQCDERRRERRPLAPPATNAGSPLVLRDLRRGDLIRHRCSGESLIVAASFGDRATAVRTYDVTNESEWLLIAKGFEGRD